MIALISVIITGGPPSQCSIEQVADRNLHYSGIVSPGRVAVLRSYVNIAAVLGKSTGAPLGGFLADIIGWRW